MSIVSLAEVFDSTPGAHTVSEGRKYVRQFMAVTNSIYDGPNTAIQAVESIGITRGAPYAMIGFYESDLNAWVTDLGADRIEGDQLGWVVTVNYGWYNVLEAGGGPNQNPLLIPIDVSWGDRDYEIVADRDINGNIIANSAQDPWDPPLMMNDKRILMTVVRNEATYNQVLAADYVNSINSDTWAGYPPLFAKCDNITPKSVFHQDVGWYYQVTYTYEFISPRSSAYPNGYRKTVPDQGLRKLFGGFHVPICFRGVPVTTPQLLNGSGAPNPVGSPAVFLSYQIYPELPFGTGFNFDATAISGTRSGFP